MTEKGKDAPDFSQVAQRLLIELGVVYAVLFLFGVTLAQGSVEEVFLTLLIAFPIFCIPYIPFRVYSLRYAKTPGLNNIAFIIPVAFLCSALSCDSLPQIIEWKIRSMIRTTFEDLQTVKEAIGLYLIDLGEFPIPIVRTSPTMKSSERSLPDSLLDPIPYLDHLPIDPYRYMENRTFGYWVAQATQSSGIEILVHSWGPDGWRDLPSDEDMDKMETITRDWLYQFQFHPTNGMKSKGDFMLWGGGGEESGNFGP